MDSDVNNLTFINLNPPNNSFTMEDSDNENESSSVSLSSVLEIPAVNSQNVMYIDEDIASSFEENEDDDILGVPITITSPVIQLKRNINSVQEEEILNNLDKSNSNSTFKTMHVENNRSSKKDQSPKPAKSEGKTKRKSKSKDRAAKTKSKFANGSIQLISEQLKGSIFSGWVQERQYVDNLKAYRDIIEVDEWEETLNQKLKMVMNSVKGVMDGTKWINITMPSSMSSTYCLWVLLESAPFPGHYWMRISDITSDPQFGLKISVKILREIHAFDGESPVARERRLKGEFTADEWKEWALSLASLNLTSFSHTFFTMFTPSNIGSGFRFIAILTVTLAVAFSKFLEKSWVFLLRLLRELGIFVHHVTPFAESVIRFVEKMFGGVFLLIAMVYRDIMHKKSPPPPPPPYPPRDFLLPPRSPPPSLTYVPPQSWVFKSNHCD